MLHGNAPFCDFVSYVLKQAGFETAEIAAGKPFPQDVRGFVVNVDDLGMNTQGFLRRMASSNVPIICVTADRTILRAANLLDFGADDVLSAPISGILLLAHLRARLRRTQHTENGAEKISIRGLVVDVQSRTVFVEESPVALTFKAFELLVYLLNNRGAVISRNKIMDVVWGTEFAGESRTVDMHIRILRRKLGKHGMYIQTVRGAGYKFE
jgi:two-component system alkaline phosphatase synthesis response regulator PhoP